MSCSKGVVRAALSTHPSVPRCGGLYRGDRRRSSCCRFPSLRVREAQPHTRRAIHDERVLSCLIHVRPQPGGGFPIAGSQARCAHVSIRCPRAKAAAKGNVGAGPPTAWVPRVCTVSAGSRAPPSVRAHTPTAPPGVCRVRPEQQRPKAQGAETLLFSHLQKTKRTKTNFK